jgi:tape measure domain-containing protein
MSTIDQRVVEMRFDNKQFESGVATTMSTLEKFKQSLNLTGASKGLENVSSAAKRCDVSALGTAVETVKSKFSALEVMGITALANITNSAVNAGKRMVSALTIDPIKTGFAEYETQINAIQTILANTQSKGTTLDDVNGALDTLNQYADKTIYNFTEMTRNIGTFTAAGVDLDTSVSAIQGIANLAAVSGSTSQQASTAMYQLSQALASGTVKLMDWNSVVNAGMGGQVFQDALRKTSKELGTGAEAAIEANGSFRESLKTGWLTSEVLTETLKKFTTSGANEYVAEYTGLSKEAVESTLESAKAQYGEADAIDKAAEALAKKSGKSKDEIKQALQLAQTSEDAATKVKTFSQLWDTLKEAAQSGWTQTWEIIVGDFE